MYLFISLVVTVLGLVGGASGGILAEILENYKDGGQGG